MVGAFAEPFALATGLVTSTVTVGVATTLDSVDTDELLRHADLALYAAKSAGKRQWRRYQPVLSAGLLRRRELQEALEEAVSTRAFTLVYQPIVALDTGELAGFEALVRWPHPEWGMMQPGQFITLAEETGQIIAIGAWVLERATTDLARWLRADRPRPPAAGPRRGHRGSGSAGRTRDLYVSVNVSARQFADAGFADNVRRVLASSGLESSALTLELTETALLRRDERLYSDLMELKDIGVKLAIDDFGTGYSSLSYLRELPFDVVKMDKSFVDGIADSEQRLALADGIVQIARTLRLEVVAEGIESEVQRDLLTEMGCHYGQGYLLAMPMQPSEAEELARHGFPAVVPGPDPPALTGRPRGDRPALPVAVVVGDQPDQRQQGDQEDGEDHEHVRLDEPRMTAPGDDRGGDGHGDDRPRLPEHPPQPGDSRHLVGGELQARVVGRGDRQAHAEAGDGGRRWPATRRARCRARATSSAGRRPAPRSR